MTMFLSRSSVVAALWSRVLTKTLTYRNNSISGPAASCRFCPGSPPTTCPDIHSFKVVESLSVTPASTAAERQFLCCIPDLSEIRRAKEGPNDHDNNINNKSQSLIMFETPMLLSLSYPAFNHRKQYLDTRRTQHNPSSCWQTVQAYHGFASAHNIIEPITTQSSLRYTSLALPVLWHLPKLVASINNQGQ